MFWRPSIRWRLTFWNALAFAAVLACFGGLVYGMLRGALYDQTDRLLMVGFRLIEEDPRVAGNPEARLRYWVEEYRDHQGLLCVVYRPDGTVMARTPGLADEDLPPAPSGPDGRPAHDGEFPGTGRQRVMARRVSLGEREAVMLLLAPLEPVDRELAHVRSVLLLAGPFALLLSAAFAYFLARKALAPVDRLRREADAVTAERLDRRLPVFNPGDELGRLTRTINAMIERLERSFAEVRRFTADASHELRTPLTVLRSEVEVALGKEMSPAGHRELLGDILEELGRMGRLTDQLLALSRRDAGVEHLEPAPLDLYALAAGVADALRPLAEAKGVQLRIEGQGPAEVHGDEARLRQVFINLLDNAIKYTPEGGAVAVRVGPRPGVVAVEDTGIGIPAEHLGRVFDRFYRVDRARGRAEGGTGLGLSIARSIVQAHGGRIEIASTAGEGTICTVTLPDRPAASNTET